MLIESSDKLIEKRDIERRGKKRASPLKEEISSLQNLIYQLLLEMKVLHEAEMNSNNSEDIEELLIKINFAYSKTLYNRYNRQY